MKSTGKYSEHEEVELNPEKPFLKDLKKDLDAINLHYNKKTSLEVKKKMIELILNDL